VQRVYDAIAWQWHGTRYKAWPRVIDFVRSLPPRSFVADLGCGNGKLAPSFHDCGHFAVGCDFSAELVRIAAGEMGMQSVVADCLALAYRDASFDAALSIAVLHHISSPERRRLLVAETLRVLRPGGRALFYAWALEQHDGVSGHDFGARDVFVPFHQQDAAARRDEALEKKAGGVYDAQKRATVFQRYCHVYAEGELRGILDSVGGCLVLNEYYDTGNWCAVVQKEGDGAADESQGAGARCAARDDQQSGSGGAGDGALPRVAAQSVAQVNSGASGVHGSGRESVDVEVTALLGEMLQQVEAISRAADGAEREAQYDALAEMVERARLAGGV